MKRYSLYLLPLIVATFIFAQEPSAFGAGDINSDTPYGLTQSEKQLYDVKKKADEADVGVKTLKNQIDSVSNQVDGIRSVYDGISTRLQDIDQAVKLLESNSNETTATLLQSIQDLKIYVEESRKIEAQNSANIKKTLQALVVNVDKNYVTKTTLNSTISSFNTAISDLEKRVISLENRKSTPSSSDLSSMSNDDALSKGEELFSAKKYSEAKPYFETLLAKNHRPARSSFVLGEIAYFTNDYSKAIENYKKSAELYQEASWMPKLLYHTAISFDKIDDKANADQFYKALKQAFPDSEEAKASPDR